MIDWLTQARALPSSERARHLAAPEPTRSTTVDPELTESLLELRHWVDRAERIRYANRFARRYGRSAAVVRLDALATSVQCRIEHALECVEQLVGAGRGAR